MTKKDTQQIKKNYGYSIGEEKMMYKYNPTIPKGNFVIVPRYGNHYWYFQLGVKRPQDKSRMKYLCKCFEGVNELGETSFEVSVQTLINKVKEDFSKKTHQNTRITTLCDEFIREIWEEEQKKENRKQETTSSIRNGVRQFREWVNVKDYRFNDMLDPRGLKGIVKEYLEYLGEKPSPSGNKGLSHNTRRTYLKQVRYFCEWLEDEDVGKGTLPSNPITRDFCKKILPPSKQEKSGVSDRNYYYESRWYDDMWDKCGKKVRDLWRTFIKEGHTRSHRNQPLGVGSDIVWFGSLLQLDSGFRIGEILKSYRSREHYLDSKDRMNNSSFTYWEKKEGEWCLFIYWKGKESVVPITTKIRSWTKPPFDDIEIKEHTRGEGKNQTKFYDVSVIDVCMKMFRESPFLFSSPLRKRNKLGHYSQTQYSTNFKNILSCKGEESMGWEGYGVFTSHDLRDYFITHKLYEGMSIEDVSRISRNSIQTIQRYYLRMDIGGQLKIQKDMDETRKFVSDRKMKQRREEWDK